MDKVHRHLRYVVFANVIVILALLWGPCFAETGEKITNITDELCIKSIDDGVYLVTHSFPWPANSLLVEMDSSNMVLIDTPYEPQATKALLNYITTQFGEKTITAINTGFHVDNLGGNAALIEEGIPVYGANLTTALLNGQAEHTREQMLGWLKDPKDKRYYDVYKTLRFVAPNRVYSIGTGLTLRFGDKTVEVYYPGPSHTLDNVVVYVPHKKLLFGGCMVLSAAAQKLGFTGDADLNEWPKSLQNVLAKYPEAAIVVPGHGEPGGKGLIEHSLTLF